MVKDIRLGFNHRESWDKLQASGERLLEKFVCEEFPKLGEVSAVERRFPLARANQPPAQVILWKSVLLGAV